MIKKSELALITTKEQAVQNYPTSLTNSQWQCIHKILNDKRRRRTSLRRVWNAIHYQARSGCQWRQLPREFGKWSTVYYYFRKWLIDGTLQRVQARIREMVRRKLGRNASPSMGIIDSQSIKNSERGIPDKGYDGDKRINGRKRHIVVDTQGLLLCVVVTPANDHDSVAAAQVIRRIEGKFPLLKKLLGDGGYRGKPLRQLAKKHLKAEFEVGTRSEEVGFKVIPQRWVVERTIAWFSWFRRLSRDYEANMEPSEAWILLASIFMMINKI